MEGILFLSSLPSNVPPISNKPHLAIKSKKYVDCGQVNSAEAAETAEI